MVNALSICQSAYRQANLDQSLSDFSVNQDFPYCIALDLLNIVIQDINRQGNFWFTQSSVRITGTSATIDLSPLGIDPKKIVRIRREQSLEQGELIAVNWRIFQQNFRQSVITNGRPTIWSRYNQTVQLNVTPDKDYLLTIYHYQDIPTIQSVSDDVMFPDSDSDVLTEGVFAYLLLRMGRPDFGTAYQLYQTKLKTLLGNQKQDSSLPIQMPANF